MSLNDSLSIIEEAKFAVWDYPINDKYSQLVKSIEDFPMNIKEAVDRVNTGKFAWIGDANDIRYIVRTNCEFKTIGDEFSKRPYGIAVQKGSPLKDKFNKALVAYTFRIS